MSSGAQLNMYGSVQVWFTSVMHLFVYMLGIKHGRVFDLLQRMIAGIYSSPALAHKSPDTHVSLFAFLNSNLEWDC